VGFSGGGGSVSLNTLGGGVLSTGGETEIRRDGDGDRGFSYAGSRIISSSNSLL
jgi:hypothetical protein